MQSKRRQQENPIFESRSLRCTAVLSAALQCPGKLPDLSGLSAQEPDKDKKAVSEILSLPIYAPYGSSKAQLQPLIRVPLHKY